MSGPESRVAPGGHCDDNAPPHNQDAVPDRERGMQIRDELCEREVRVRVRLHPQDAESRRCRIARVGPHTVAPDERAIARVPHVSVGNATCGAGIGRDPRAQDAGRHA